MMTATVLMQLVEEGALSLDDHLVAHLPDVAAALPFGDVITIRQLSQSHLGRLQLHRRRTQRGAGYHGRGAFDQGLLARSYTPEELSAS